MASHDNKWLTYFHLSDKDPDTEFTFWVNRKELVKHCKIKHAWARTIHTFQVICETLQDLTCLGQNYSHFPGNT